MALIEIETYLKNRNEILDVDILNEIEQHLKNAQENEDENTANYCWCLKQIYKVKKEYLSAYKFLKASDFENAWYNLERADIELSFLEEHFDIGDYVHDPYGLVLIKNVIPKFQKLYPYKVFISRETLIKKEVCSICGKEVKLRGGCKHKTRALYMGRQCSRIVEDMEFLGIALVSDPFDKYGILKVEGQEYNYELIKYISDNIKNPYDLWNYEISKRIIPEYKRLGRNDACACGSGKKYKHCCMNTERIYEDHYKFNLLYGSHEMKS